METQDFMLTMQELVQCKNSVRCNTKDTSEISVMF